MPLIDGYRVMVLLIVGPSMVGDFCWQLLLVATMSPVLVLLTWSCSVLVSNLLNIIERIVLTWVYVSTETVVLGTTGRQTVIWLLVWILRLASMPVVPPIRLRRLVQAIACALLGLFLKRTVIPFLKFVAIRWLM